ncbi:MAG: hypothetical protein P0116_10070, partial [Candidatus Nitrosocosmicus sp.]|nr:hypothetical protein [Candidatus Nitrosocosmicus sp.]
MLYKNGYNKDIPRTIMNNIHFILIGAVFISSLFIAPVLQMSSAHQEAVFEINGKDYLFVIGSANEPLSVD